MKLHRVAFDVIWMMVFFRDSRVWTASSFTRCLSYLSVMSSASNVEEDTLDSLTIGRIRDRATEARAYQDHDVPAF
jgi:hypothetical protein